MRRPRVLLADDSALVRAAFEKLLEEDCDVVGAVADGRALVESAGRLHPDLVIAEIAMPLLNGLDAAREIRRRWPSVKVMFLTMRDDPELAAAAMRAGASGYLLKRSAVPELLTAIREVAHGRSYVTPLVAEGMLGALVRGDAPIDQPELTGRQRQVLQLLAEGRSMKEVADVLKVTPRTIAFHKYRMMDELHIRTNAELIQYAVREHLV